MDSQLKIIKERLLRGEPVTRNWALRNYIGRLASRITDLKNDGMMIKGFTITYLNDVGKKCRDYEYVLEQGQQKLL